MSLLPSTKSHTATRLSRVFVKIFPRVLYQLPLGSVPSSTSRLFNPPKGTATKLSTSIEGHHDGASTTLALDLLPVGHYLRTGIASLVGHYLRTRAAYLLATTSTLDLLLHRELPPHRGCFLRQPLPSMSSYPDDWVGMEHPSIVFAQSFLFASSSRLQAVVGLYSPLCHESVMNIGY